MYLFLLADEIVPITQFGGREPSSILDAGQYLYASELAAREVHVPVDSENAVARYWLVRAIACLDEVLKWIPEGAGGVPRSALFTKMGSDIYEHEPERFGRARLVAVKTTYRGMLLGIR